MVFRDEREAVTELAELVLDAAANLHKATKYIYSLSKNNFYNCNVKDAFKIVLNNIFDASALRTLGLSMNDSECEEMSSAEYRGVFSLMVYSFAVRLPLLRNLEVQGKSMTEQQLRAVYDVIISKGVVNHGDVVPESFEGIRQDVKKGREAPAYNADWYKVYLHAKVPALADITNRNLFLFGMVDVLFPMFYLRLEQELGQELLRLCASVRQV